MIDSRAIVDSGARLADGVKVGPFSIIGPDVEIGAGTEIGPHVVIRGPTRIGRDNRIYQFSSVGEDPQDKKYHGELTCLVVGDRNVVREFATLHRGTSQGGGETRVGHDNLLMAYTHVAHDCIIGNHTILANAASLGGHVLIDDWAILGGFTIVHQFCAIGAHSFCGMGSVVSMDIPPYVTVSGNPSSPHGINAEGLRRRGYDAEAIQAIRRAYKILYKSEQRLDQALQQLREIALEAAEVEPMIRFLERSQRGICR